MQILVNIDVEDLERALAFYLAALPLRLERRLFDGTVAELAGASSRIYLLQKAAGDAATGDDCCRHVPGVRDYGRHWTPVHLDFEVSDVEAGVARAVAAGAVQETPIRDFAWGRLTTLADPFGNGFCLLQFNGGIYEGTE